MRYIQSALSLLLIWITLNTNVNAFVKVMISIVCLTYLVTLLISIFIKRKNN